MPVESSKSRTHESTRGPHRGGQQDDEQQAGECEKDLADAHDDGVDPLAEVPRQQPKCDAQCQAARADSGRRDDEVGAEAVDHAAEDVAADEVGTEQVLGAGALPHREQVLVVEAVGREQWR